MKKTKIGLCLSAGSARGLAHIGVLKVLLRHGIQVNCISGSSMGSLVGGLYAAGVPVDVLEALAVNINQKKWVDFSPPKMGFIRGDKILNILRLVTKNKHIENLSLPYGCVATDLISGNCIEFTEGNLAEAVRGSISIPGVFNPYELNDMLLTDGAVIERLPVKLCHKLGADFVISCDVNTQVSENSVNSIFDVILQSMNIMQSEIIKGRRTESDVLIRPHVKEINPNQFHRAEELIARGEEACEEVIPAIKRELQGVK